MTVSSRARTPVAVLSSALLLAVLAAATGCAAKTPPVAGSVRMAGSVTVQPLTDKITEAFLAEGNTTEVSTAPVSTDTAIERFCAAGLDVADLSRPLTADERANCARNGVRYQRIQVANDAIVLASNPALHLGCLTMKQLSSWWGASADGTITTWRALKPSYPDTAMDLYGSGPGSGTYEVFSRLVEDSADGLRHDFTVTPQEDVIAAGVARSKGGAGFMPYPVYSAMESKLTALAVDDGSGCQKPTIATVQTEAYPLSRPLYLYVRQASWDKRAAVRAYVRYYVDHAHDVAGALRYVPLTEHQESAAERAVDALQ